MSYSAYTRLRVLVWASNREVIKAARLRLCERHRRDPSVRKARHEYYRAMLAAHKSAQETALQYRL